MAGLFSLFGKKEEEEEDDGETEAHKKLVHGIKLGIYAHQVNIGGEARRERNTAGPIMFGHLAVIISCMNVMQIFFLVPWCRTGTILDVRNL